MAPAVKSALHESIENIEDEGLLLAVQEMLSRKYAAAPLPPLSEAQKNRLEAARAELAAGKGIAGSEADRLIDEWLSK